MQMAHAGVCHVQEAAGLLPSGFYDDSKFLSSFKLAARCPGIRLPCDGQLASERAVLTRLSAPPADIQEMQGLSPRHSPQK